MRRLKTLRRPPIYPKTPGHLPCSSLTHPLPLSSRRPSVSFGGFGLRTKTSLPERLQATQLKILGIKDADGNAISGTASAGDAGKKVFVEDWEAPSTGRYYIAVGTEGTDRTGTYWISITRKN